MQDFWEKAPPSCRLTLSMVSCMSSLKRIEAFFS